MGERPAFLSRTRKQRSVKAGDQALALLRICVRCKLLKPQVEQGLQLNRGQRNSSASTKDLLGCDAANDGVDLFWSAFLAAKLFQPQRPVCIVPTEAFASESVDI